MALVLLFLEKYFDRNNSPEGKEAVLRFILQKVEANGGKILELVPRFNLYRKMDDIFAMDWIRRFLESRGIAKTRVLGHEKTKFKLKTVQSIELMDMLYGSSVWDALAKRFSVNIGPTTSQEQLDAIVEKMLRYLLYRKMQVLDYQPCTKTFEGYITLNRIATRLERL